MQLSNNGINFYFWYSLKFWNFIIFIIEKIQHCHKYKLHCTGNKIHNYKISLFFAHLNSSYTWSIGHEV